MAKSLGIGLAIEGIGSWFFPQFQGFFFEPTNVTTSEGRIIGAILIVGGAPLYFSRRGIQRGKRHCVAITRLRPTGWTLGDLGEQRPGAELIPAPEMRVSFRK